MNITTKHRGSGWHVSLEQHLTRLAERTLGLGISPRPSALGRRIQNVLIQRPAAMKSLSAPTRLSVAFGVFIAALIGLRLVSVAAAPIPSQSAQAAHVQADLKTSLAQLSRIGYAILQYTQDNDERLPDASHWMDEISPYLIPAQVTGKERQREMIALFHDPAAPAGQTWNYAYNRLLSNLPIAKVNNPAEVVEVFESTKGIRNANGIGRSIPQQGWHGVGTDYLFVDGHPKWYGPQGRQLPFRPDTPQTSAVAQKTRQQPSSTATLANQLANIIRLQSAKERAQQQFYVSTRSVKILHEDAARMKRSNSSSHHSMTAFLMKQANIDKANAAQAHAEIARIDAEMHALKR